MPSVQKLEFVSELPERRGGSAPRKHWFERFVAPLQDRPDEWALIARDENSFTVQSLSRSYPDFEFTSRTPEGKNAKSTVKNKLIYARYRGTEWYLAQQRKKDERKASRLAQRAAQQARLGEVA